MGSEENYNKFINRIEEKKDKIISIKEFKSLFEEISDTPENTYFNKIFRIYARRFIREDLLTYLMSNKK